MATCFPASSMKPKYGTVFVTPAGSTPRSKTTSSVDFTGACATAGSTATSVAASVNANFRKTMCTLGSPVRTKDGAVSYALVGQDFIDEAPGPFRFWLAEE